MGAGWYVTVVRAGGRMLASCTRKMNESDEKIGEQEKRRQEREDQMK